MADPDSGEPARRGLGEGLKQAKAAWETATWLIEAGTIVVTFIRGVGGPVQFLVEVGTYGLACYIAIWVFLPLAMAAVSGLERVAKRESTDMAAGIIAGLAVLGGGALLRFGLFAPGLTEDLDAIGTAFSALVGIAVLTVPFIVLWYFRGSKPQA